MAEPAAEETVKPIAFDLEQLHATWKNHWPLKGQSMLFIGNRRSREPCWLAQRGCVLVAVDPSSPKSARSGSGPHRHTQRGGCTLAGGHTAGTGYLPAAQSSISSDPNKSGELGPRCR